MIVLVTVVLENFRAVRRAVRRHGRPPPGALGSPGTVPADLIAQMGGRLLAVDWERGEVVREWRLPTPAGLCWPRADGPLFVASAYEDALLTVTPEDGEVARWSLPSMSDLHSVVPDGDGFLLTSSGVDAVLRIDAHGRLDAAWWATAHGWNTAASGQHRQLDIHADHRGSRPPTLHRVLHPTMARRIDGRVVVVSFHKGWVARVDLHTGACTVLRGGLDHPHGLTVIPPDVCQRWGLSVDGPVWMVCDTGRGCVRLMHGPHLEDCRVFSGLRWVQDACVTPDGQLFVLDGLHFGRGRGGHDLVELDPHTGAARKTVSWSADWRLFGLLPLDAARSARILGGTRGGA